ncbi:glycosyltransferase family 2 protein [Candidatus Saccharibacteria bacterium]|nr:glycosyltransferase family 2 protein [Candidatus Saccharibacteria bacterium]
MATANNHPLVSVVVLNWNRKKFVDPFMKTIMAQSYPKEKLEVLFTDNASSDGSVQYIKEKYGDLPYLKIVQNDKNYGYSKGNNLGIHRAKGDYVLVCNNDLQLEKNLIEDLVAVAKQKRAGATVPKLVYANKKGYLNNAGSRLEPTSDWPIYEDGKDEKDEGQYDKIREITAFCGACVLFSRQFLHKVGLFDPKFFMYFEDGDLSWRGQKAGFKFFYAPRAIAYHVHTGTTTEGSPIFNFFVGRNRILILTKNAEFKVIAKGWLKTWRDHLLLRLKRLFLAAVGRYPRRLALRELLASQRMIWGAIFMTPYALGKRFRIIKEDKL